MFHFLSLVLPLSNILLGFFSGFGIGCLVSICRQNCYGQFGVTTICHTEISALAVEHTDNIKSDAF